MSAGLHGAGLSTAVGWILPVPGHRRRQPGSAVTPLKPRRRAVIRQGATVDHGLKRELDIAQVPAYVANLSLAMALADASPPDVEAQPHQDPVPGAYAVVSNGEKVGLHASSDRTESPCATRTSLRAQLWLVLRKVWQRW
ncbi:protein of unknown function [Streptomyces murinus]